MEFLTKKEETDTQRAGKKLLEKYSKMGFGDPQISVKLTHIFEKRMKQEHELRIQISDNLEILKSLIEKIGLDIDKLKKLNLEEINDKEELINFKKEFERVLDLENEIDKKQEERMKLKRQQDIKLKRIEKVRIVMYQSRKIRFS